MRRLFYCILFVITTGVTSCSKSNNIGNTVIPITTVVHVSNIKIIDSAVAVISTTKKQLFVAITPVNATNKGITWASDNTAIAIVDASGWVTGITEGTANIIATSADNTSIMDIIKITVLKANYDVYVVGKANTLQYVNAAVYWKNGVVTPLLGGYGEGKNAWAITIANNDVYIAGSTLNQYNWNVATYWKNGVAVQLSNPANTFHTYATSIAVNGSDVYVSGYDNFGHYWKSSGGTVTDFPLFDGSVASSKANGITLSSATVYVTGSQSNDNLSNLSKYWVNNFSQAVSLTNGSYAGGNAIATQGSDIYIVGSDGCAVFGCIPTAKLWKNGPNSVISLTDGTKSANAFCLGLSGNIVYVAGYERNDMGKAVAKLWKIIGSTVTPIAITDGQSEAMIKSMVIVGNEIFMAGFETDNSTGYRVAKYWRAFDTIVLPPVTLISVAPISGNAEADGIFVQ